MSSCILDTATVDLTIASGVLSADAKISADAGNNLSAHADGLYASGAALGYGTTLPASPVDGDEYVLVDSVTNPTYQWRFRYNAGSVSAYKWEFVGGAPKVYEVATDESDGSNAYVDLTTPGPTITLPAYAGDWDVAWGCNCYNTAGASDQYMTPKYGAAATADTDGEWSTSSQANYSEVVTRQVRKTGLAAGTVILCQYKAAPTGHWRRRWLRVQPVRIG